VRSCVQGEIIRDNAAVSASSLINSDCGHSVNGVCVSGQSTDRVTQTARCEANEYQLVTHNNRDNTHQPQVLSANRVLTCVSQEHSVNALFSEADTHFDVIILKSLQNVVDGPLFQFNLANELIEKK